MAACGRVASPLAVLVCVAAWGVSTWVTQAAAWECGEHATWLEDGDCPSSPSSCGDALPYDSSVCNYIPFRKEEDCCIQPANAEWHCEATTCHFGFSGLWDQCDSGQVEPHEYENVRMPRRCPRRRPAPPWRHPSASPHRGKRPRRLPPCVG